MAKEDFCFTYYDGDAARDMAHMTRIERGAYTDIIISIRKFGHLTADQIKKILSRDFDECFPAIELILLKDDEGKFYIDWLENSLQKSKKHSTKQRNNRLGSTKQLPNDNQNSSLDAPLGNGDGYEIENKKELLGKSENPLPEEIENEPAPVFQIPHILDVDLLLEKVLLDGNFKIVYTGKGLTESSLRLWLENFNKWLRFTGEGSKVEKDYRTHFNNWLNQRENIYEPENFSIQNKKINNGNNDRPGHKSTIPESKYVGTGF